MGDVHFCISVAGLVLRLWQLVIGCWLMSDDSNIIIVPGYPEKRAWTWCRLRWGKIQPKNSENTFSLLHKIHQRKHKKSFRHNQQTLQIIPLAHRTNAIWPSTIICGPCTDQGPRTWRQSFGFLTRQMRRGVLWESSVLQMINEGRSVWTTSTHLVDADVSTSVCRNTSGFYVSGFSWRMQHTIPDFAVFFIAGHLLAPKFCKLTAEIDLVLRSPTLIQWNLKLPRVICKM